MRAVILLFLGCRPDDGGPSAPPAPWDTATPGADTASPWSAGDPAWDAEAVGIRLQDALAVGLPATPSLLSWFLALEGMGDPGSCPHYNGYSLGESFAGCTASTGWSFVGFSVYTQGAQGTPGFTLDGDCYIQDPEGLTWECAGKVELNQPDPDTYTLSIAGLWGYPLADGWVASAPDLALWVDVSDGAVAVDGGWMPYDDATYFDDVHLDATGGASGALRLRDPSGGWYVLALGADGCGPVDWAGATLGTTCVDLVAPFADMRARQRESP